MTLLAHFLTIVVTSSKCTLSKVRISICAASLNDRKDRRKDKFSPGECVLVIFFDANNYAVVAGGDNSDDD